MYVAQRRAPQAAVVELHVRETEELHLLDLHTMSKVTPSIHTLESKKPNLFRSPSCPCP